MAGRLTTSLADGAHQETGRWVAKIELLAAKEHSEVCVRRLRTPMASITPLIGV